MIRLAIPKGRLSEPVADLLQRSGYDCGELRNGSRRLAFTMGDIEATLVKPSDVAVYVEHGAADIGVVGKDVLMEDELDVFEFMDFGFGTCRTSKTFVRCSTRRISSTSSAMGRTPSSSSVTLIPAAWALSMRWEAREGADWTRRRV